MPGFSQNTPDPEQHIKDYEVCYPDVFNDIMKEWNNFSDQSRLFASEKFDIKEMYQKYINVVNQLIEQG